MSLSLDIKTTALVLIDLQQGIVARNCAPYSTADVISNSVRLADAFRAHGGAVVLVTVSFAADGGNMLKHPLDDQTASMGKPPEGWDRLVPELKQVPSDILITKHNWSAFYGTALDLELRRRGIATIVLGGVATNMGVESTARSAWEHNYQVVFVEDAMTTILGADAHAFATTKIFPRIGRVRSTEDVLKALS